jgi:carboxyl-terminal processing protease
MKKSAYLPGIALILALGAIALTTRLEPPALAATDEAKVAKVTARLLEQVHYSGQRFDDDVSAQFLDRYLEMLDGARLLFLQSDLDEFARYRTSLDDLTLKAGDTAPAYEIFGRFQQRLEERAAYAQELLKTETFDFTSDETYAPDRAHAAHPRDLAEAKQLWRQQLRFEYLQEKLNGKKPDEIVGTLTRRYERSLHATKQLSHDQVFEMYLTALAHVYDPHSDYMGRRQVEDFSIAMNLSLVGIGATLGPEDGYCKIRELVPGGPAARSKLLKPGDRITAVAQDGQEPVDIIDMPLPEAVALIRGVKGTKVHLTVTPADSTDTAARQTITLVRDEVKLEEQQARARILDLPMNGSKSTRIGLIDLPSFYSSMEGQHPGGKKSATADVAKLLEKLKEENVGGIVLDLRRNGGGSLEEAVSLTGLFIQRGPVVQTKDPEGHVEVEADTDASVAYDGPLIVLTSRFSASASEIVAGALRDYGRALIVGDSSTYGKGTVQSVMQLGNVMRRVGLSSKEDPGALKLTIRKFYLPGGASTQLKGVVPDIVLPSLNNEAKVGEAEMFHALPWDQVPAARFRSCNLVQPHLAVLREKSAKRIAADPDFTWLREDIEKFRERQANPTVSLNEGQRRKEKSEADAKVAVRKKERERHAMPLPTAYEITLKNADQAGLPEPNSASAGVAGSHSAPVDGDEDPDSPTDARVHPRDITLDETMRILADYSALLRDGKPSRLANQMNLEN